MTALGSNGPKLLAQARALLRRRSSRAIWAGGLGLLGLLGLEALTRARSAETSTLVGLGLAPDPLDTGGLVIGVLLKLGLVIALIYASLYLLRRWQGGLLAPRTRQVAVLESTRLAPHQAMHLVRVGGQVFLIGATDQSVTVLAELDPVPTQPSAASPVAATGFPATLVRALGRSDQL